MTNKQIRKIRDKYGDTLNGEAYYWAYSTWGVQKEDLELVGFKIIDDSGFWKAKSQHSADSNVLAFKMWKEDVVTGLLDIRELIEDGSMNIKQAVNFMWDVCKEWHGRWPEAYDTAVMIRFSNIAWFYENKTPEQKVCDICDPLTLKLL